MFIFEKAPFPSCHASTIVEIEPGVLQAAWFGGKDEGAKDVQIWSSRFSAGKWSNLEILGTEPGQPCWNPVLFRTKKGTLWLWYKFGPSPMTWTGAARKSTDGGKSWSPPQLLPAGFYGPVRAKPIELEDGTILAGTSLESYRCWTPYVDYSTDDGQTWLRSTPFNVEGKFGQIQPTIFAAKDKRIVALMRSREPRMICISESKDGGKTFTAAKPTTLGNPSAGIDAVKTRSGEVYLIYDPNPLLRTPISLARSRDDGLTWEKVADLETEAGEYSYPAMIENSEGKLEITYTWRRTHIKHVTFDPKQAKK